MESPHPAVAAAVAAAAATACEPDLHPCLQPTIHMIKQLLKEKGIKLRGKTRKAYMLKLLEAADAAEAGK